MQLGFGRGALIMSNIFLSSAFIDLANDAAGCTEIVNDERVVMEDCPYTVYGMKPASLVANIAVISGVLSALLMPFAGAIIDCTSYRRAVGIWTAVLMILIQGVQVYLTDDTWFAMAILQAFAAFLYQVQILCIYAYLPEMARVVGEKVMTNSEFFRQRGNKSTFFADL
jgi:MFS-type transporter involved in bile tolerance (Atg22 family)